MSEKFRVSGASCATSSCRFCCAGSISSRISCSASLLAVFRAVVHEIGQPSLNGNGRVAISKKQLSQLGIVMNRTTDHSTLKTCFKSDEQKLLLKKRCANRRSAQEKGNQHGKVGKSTQSMLHPTVRNEDMTDLCHKSKAQKKGKRKNDSSGRYCRHEIKNIKMGSSCIVSSVASTGSVSDLGYLYGCRPLQQGGATLGLQESSSSKDGVRIFR